MHDGLKLEEPIESRFPLPAAHACSGAAWTSTGRAQHHFRAWCKRARPGQVLQSAEDGRLRAENGRPASPKFGGEVCAYITILRKGVLVAFEPRPRSHHGSSAFKLYRTGSTGTIPSEDLHRGRRHGDLLELAIPIFTSLSFP